LLTASILLRIFANPVANVFQKQLTGRSAHPIFIITVVHAVLTLVCIPYSVISFDVHLPAAASANMLIAALLAVTGNVLIVSALSESDLSVLGPINAYKSVVGLVLGIFLIGERPTATGLAGVLLIVAGSYFVIDRKAGQPLANAFVRFFSERGIQLRFAALLVSATEAIFLKRAIVLSSPSIVFVLWSVLGLAMVATWMLIALRRELADQFVVLKASLSTFLSLAAATGAMQLATLFTLRDLQVGYSLALFQLSAIVSVVLGRLYFAETNIRRRLIGSIVMAAGAALIVLFGRRS
jgi:drug/metabolite transporter (DMT)-like permease